MIAAFSLQHFRFHLEPKTALHLPAYNKGNVIRREERGHSDFYNLALIHAIHLFAWSSAEKEQVSHEENFHDEGV
jgi:hypothetical protein